MTDTGTPDPREAAFQVVLDACDWRIMNLLRYLRDDDGRWASMSDATLKRACEIGVTEDTPRKPLLTDLGRLVLERKG